MTTDRSLTDGRGRTALSSSSPVVAEESLERLADNDPVEYVRKQAPWTLDQLQ